MTNNNDKKPGRFRRILHAIGTACLGFGMGLGLSTIYMHVNNIQVAAWVPILTVALIVAGLIALTDMEQRQ